MKEMYSHELPFWMKWFGIWRINTGSIDFSWGYFIPKFGFTFLLNRGGYFDQRYSITVCFIWGVLNVILPFKTRIEESCDTPRYGIAIHSNMFWIHLGGKMDPDWHQCDSKWITWELPWFSWVFDTLVVWDGDKWILPAKNEYRPPFTDGRLVETHPYGYMLKSGEVQERTATVYMERRIWHRKWFPMYNKIHTGLSIEFNDEVGEETGSWKGGCTGCGWDMKSGETMAEALYRMEAERKF